MRRVLQLILIVASACGMLPAQEDRKPQFHGYATQSFLYNGGVNNYLGMDTSSGSAAWSEAAFNVNNQVTSWLRVGAQFHMMRLGQFGGTNPTLDWALADVRIKRWFSVRAGKAKIRWGLYNDTQDADPGYLWALLPEPVYAIDWRATNLAQKGVELYGRVRLGERGGEVAYSAYYGYYSYAPHDGYMETYTEDGRSFCKQPKGITPGFDLRWATPVKGLTVGGSLMLYNAKGTLYNNASYRQPLAYWPTYYARYEKNRFFVAAQYVSLLQHDNYTLDGAVEAETTTSRSWYAMGGYRLTDKLQVGVYRTNNLITNADRTDPWNYFKDWTVSSRFDFDSHWYANLKGHFIDGYGLGFYGSNNPGDLSPRTRLLVAKLGFTF